MTATPERDAPGGGQPDTVLRLDDLLAWTREGARLFAGVVETLQRHEGLRTDRDRLEQENRQLRGQIEAARAEVEHLRRERIEAAESLKGIAEQVTRLATAALHRLGRPVC
jgi:hypothetical protein